MPQSWLWAEAADWRISSPGWQYEFPRDHGSHDDFKTEWWYFTGNLETEGGHKFGYQLTFFRQGIIPPAERTERQSRWITEQIYFVHFAITDVDRRTFVFDQVVARGGFGEAGALTNPTVGRAVWIGESELHLEQEGGLRLTGRSKTKSIDLLLKPEKGPVFHGSEGVSIKGGNPGQASHYYSFTRLETSGTVELDGQRHKVVGNSWFDHEWATNQLGDDQVGWDWLSLVFDDGTELMVFQLRRSDGSRDPFSSGTFVHSDGRTVAIDNSDFSLEPSRFWTSEATGAKYPVAWKIEIPSLQLSLEVQARLDSQELVLSPISYWEGSVAAEGERSGNPVTALGYLEMTGYAGEIVGM